MVLFCLQRHNSATCSELQVAYGFPGGSMVKNPPADAGDAGLIPGWERTPGRKRQPPRVFWPGESHGQRLLAG